MVLKQWIWNPINCLSLSRLNTPAKGNRIIILKAFYKGGFYIFNFSSQLSGTYYWFSWRILGSEFSAIFCSLEGTPIIDEVLWRLLSQRLEDSWRLLSQGFALAFALGGSWLTWLSHWKKFVRVFVLPFLLTIFGNEDGVWEHHSLVYG